MLDLATVPLEIYADWLEEQGEDPQELREFALLGTPLCNECLVACETYGEPVHGKKEDWAPPDGSDLLVSDLLRGKVMGMGWRLMIDYQGTYLDY